MNYISTRKSDEHVSFKEAVVNGLTKNGGLYFPETIPTLPPSFFDTIETLTDHEIAYQVLKPFVEGSLNEKQLKDVISETISFPTPTISVEENIYALELFHGPTQAFKDVGARFMSRCLSHFYSEEKNKVTIIVATSGDTGSAVANGFYKVPQISVKILFPKAKVSPFQEFQMTSLGKNIHALEVEGTFDDCQKLVKEAFNDVELRERITLSSANSINVARLLPQTLYYFFAYKQLKSKLNNKRLVVSVPSGNLGNITAGLLAKKIGLPISHFISGLNANDTFLKYLESGTYHKKKSVQTFANAMDVGNPSNFERIEYLYDYKVEEVRKDISAYSYNNEEILKEIKQCHDQNEYLLDPHGAIGKLALSDFRDDKTIGIFLGTAHPQKFSEVIQKVIPNYEAEAVDLKNCKKQSIQNSYEDFRKIILESI